MFAYDFVRHFLQRFGLRDQSVHFKPTDICTKIAKCRSYLILTDVSLYV